MLSILKFILIVFFTLDAEHVLATEVKNPWASLMIFLYFVYFYRDK